MQSAAQISDSPDQLSEIERQFQSVKVTVFGRYMLENKLEYPCQVAGMSPGSATIIGPNAGSIGETVVAYIDHVGRIEGKVLRIFPGGFAMSITATPYRRDKLAAQITWVANKHELNLPEDRRHERVTPTKKLAQIKLEDGRTYDVRIIDLSMSGAAIELDVRPAIGTLIWLGNMRGRVVRHFDDGVALEFAILQNHDTLQDFAAR